MAKTSVLLSFGGRLASAVFWSSLAVLFLGEARLHILRLHHACRENRCMLKPILPCPPRGRGGRLTLGLMGLDELHLRVLSTSSDDEAERRNAAQGSRHTHGCRSVNIP
jgi:hypothetical protein